MNTSTTAKKILCYGDSNTWGQKPDRAGRYDANERWTGIVQDILGTTYEVIEEGLGGRTINLDVPDRVGRNGKTYLTPCLITHSPIDMIIVMLGTNDLKKFFTATAQSIKESLSGLVDDVYAATSEHPPKILLVSPIIINSSAPRFWEFYTDFYNQHSDSESHKLAGAIEALCAEHNLEFLDAARYATAGEDGIHLDLASCKALGNAIAAKIKETI